MYNRVISSATSCLAQGSGLMGWRSGLSPGVRGTVQVSSKGYIHEVGLTAS